MYCSSPMVTNELLRNTVVFTATSSTQRSMPYKEKQHGMFTYFLLKALRDSGGKATVGTLFEATRKDVVKNSIWINYTPRILHSSFLILH